MARKSTFRIAKGSGGVVGHANRTRTASTGANNQENYDWQKTRGGYAGAGTGPAPSGPDYSACELTIDEAGDGAYESFDCYAEATTITDPLSAHLNWDAAWVFRNNYTGVQASDTFEDYDEENPVTATLQAGDGWDGVPWVYRDLPTGVQAIDTFEDYDEENPVSSDLDAGSGFATDWVIKNIS